MEMVIDDRATDAELNSLIRAAEAQLTDLRQAIARLEQIRDMAKHKMVCRAIHEAEVE